MGPHLLQANGDQIFQVSFNGLFLSKKNIAITLPNKSTDQLTNTNAQLPSQYKRKDDATQRRFDSKREEWSVFICFH